MFPFVNQKLTNIHFLYICTQVLLGSLPKQLLDDELLKTGIYGSNSKDIYMKKCHVLVMWKHINPLSLVVLYSMFSSYIVGAREFYIWMPICNGLTRVLLQLVSPVLSFLHFSLFCLHIQQIHEVFCFKKIDYSKDLSCRELAGKLLPVLKAVFPIGSSSCRQTGILISIMSNVYVCPGVSVNSFVIQYILLIFRILQYSLTFYVYFVRLFQKLMVTNRI